MQWVQIAGRRRSAPLQRCLASTGAVRALSCQRASLPVSSCTSRIAVPQGTASLRCAQAYRHRNAMMREWVANQTSGAHYIDFDALALAPDVPAACADFNKHYACQLNRVYGAEQPGANYFRDPYQQVRHGLACHQEHRFPVARKSIGRCRASKLWCAAVSTAPASSNQSFPS